MTACHLCGAEDRETCDCWEVVSTDYPPCPDAIVALLEKKLFRPTEH